MDIIRERSYCVMPGSFMEKILGKKERREKMEKERMYAEVICQFCGKRVKNPDDANLVYECENCGAEYWVEDAGDTAEEVLKAEEGGYEIRILEDYDLCSNFFISERVHVVFKRPKEICFGAD